MKKILLVEDEALIAMSEKVILERYGYEVRIAHSGTQAIETFKKEGDIDLVLMDIDLGPGIDGTIAAQAILSGGEVPVVFLSSHREPEVVEKTEKITSYGYIVKSSGETVLVASIKMAFRLFESRLKERQALRKLTHSQDLMRYIVSHARSAIAVHDRNLNYLYVSDEYLRSYDVEIPEVIGRHHYEVFPDLPQKWRDVHQRSLKGETVSAEDDVFERADGQVLWTRWESRPWYEDDGTIGGIVINTEVTDRTQRLQKLLVDNRDFLTTLVETALEGFCVVDSRGLILEVNSVFAAITGYGASELTSKPIWEIDAFDDGEDAMQRMDRIREQGKDVFDTTLTRRDGTTIDVRVSVRLVSRDSRSFLVFFLPRKSQEALGAGIELPNQ